MLEHLGAAGLEKCRAYNTVLRHTMALQKSGDGAITRLQRKRLSSELANARAMTPKRMTAMDCGVPL